MVRIESDTRNSDMKYATIQGRVSENPQADELENMLPARKR